MRCRNYYLLLIVTLLAVVSCQKKTEADHGAQVQSWFNQLQLQRNKNIDSMRYFAQLIDRAAQSMTPAYQAIAHISQALVHSNTANYQTALKEYEIAEKLLFTNPVDSLAGRIYAGMGTAHTNLGNYATALEYLFKAMRIFEKSGYQPGIGGVASQISQVYQLKGELNIAKTYVMRGLDAMKNTRLHNGYVVNLHTLANIYGMSNELDSALAIDEIGIRICDSMHSSFLKSMFYDNKANCFNEKGSYDSARFYHLQCLQIDSTHGNMKQVSDTYLNLGGMYLKKGDPAMSIACLSRSIELARSTGYLLGLQTAWELQAHAYHQLNKLDLALEAKDSSMAARNRMINAKSEATIAELNTLYETEKREQTILLQQSQLSKQRILIIAIIAFVLAVAVAVYMNFRRSKLKREKEIQDQLHQQQQEATVKILEAEEHERKRIATDLHDGVGQLMMAAWMNLQAYEQQLDKNSPNHSNLGKAIDLVGESCREVRAVSHSMMPNALLKKGLVNAIRDFVQQIDQQILSINLHTEGLEMHLEPHAETVLYRVIQESVNNVIKHAKASQLDISIHHNPNEGTDVLIEDNGQGFELDKALQKDGIGLQNISNRIQYLGGSVDWDTSPGNGTVVSIHIPAKK